ncbi:conserved Plasmodium protein, unknown function [Plasmodium berghei]|uniref:Ribosomal RNA-processing protein 14/surfeit locus protein 6 C-terminal domain-containing protein n=2 Tax=Plasmodium berghei TaxID=5821 RepID=A0A509AIU6_PLABA|nr:conserved Plasmodium protein, unknown function [Plasmodium berghei ANKA]CXI35700.1 conserved Plasmodium protein, unknown function [Plasmodium berghei]SCM21530.1 conserved Plasmodium protein, unknown function [Plasmodium berghei]SCN24730.1 conserved Plasmodium protein, unknown function [Plasmodium berghei]SCO59870.1 conserved Plasmodium protein, unknown function [Plasmodium berghei]SCO61186.1 conserved Plasmodium protein, unknown function [Plasmodium berghei]|eukprot:XP_034421266.1 conserved Plasmodium protein, unknown function [Plasmodium berghei ANKA]
MSIKKNKITSNYKSTKKNKKKIGANNDENDSFDDLVIGNIPNANGDMNKKNIPRMAQISKSYKKLEKEKKLLNSLESKEKEKTKHLLNVQKAILKSKGEKVYDEKSLKNRKKNILKKKEKSRKRWNNKNDE